MSIQSEQLLAEFKQFDFSERETRIYLALLQEGELSAGDLHRLTSLPQPKIYSLMERMCLRGLCRVRMAGRYRYYQAVKPSVVLDTLRYQWDEERTSKVQVATRVLRDLERNLSGVGHSQLDFVEVIRNDIQIQQVYLQLLNESRREVLAFNRTPYAAKTERALQEQLDAQQAAIDRGVRLRSIHAASREQLGGAPPRKLGEQDLMRYVDQLPVKMFIFDCRTVIMAMPSADQAAPLVVSMLKIQHHGFAALCEMAFEAQWTLAKDYEAHSRGD